MQRRERGRSESFLQLDEKTLERENLDAVLQAQHALAEVNENSPFDAGKIGDGVEPGTRGGDGSGARLGPASPCAEASRSAAAPLLD